ncbi:hypothetical protein I204_01874 [Kwoniella mangroviensis CBS 8886]|nr:hypothetical protein I204_01874 [Kwoniella mangroviensis CBS 8886]
MANRIQIPAALRNHVLAANNPIMQQQTIGLPPNPERMLTVKLFVNAILADEGTRRERVHVGRNEPQAQQPPAAPAAGPADADDGLAVVQQAIQRIEATVNGQVQALDRVVQRLDELTAVNRNQIFSSLNLPLVPTPVAGRDFPEGLPRAVQRLTSWTDVQELTLQQVNIWLRFKNTEPEVAWTEAQRKSILFRLLGGTNYF